MSTNLPAKQSARLVGSAALALSCRQLMSSEMPDGHMMTNIAPDDPDFEDVLFSTEEPATREWTQHTVKPFHVQWWFAKKITIEDEKTGEPQPTVRVTLISPELETLSFASLGVAASLDLLRSTRGDGPYDPALPVVFSEVKTRKGWKMVRMRPWRESDEE